MEVVDSRSNSRPRKGHRSWTGLAVLGLVLAACAGPRSSADSAEDWRRAEVATQAGDWDRAASLWNRIRMDAYDTDVRPHLETAEALIRMGEQDEALALLRHAEALFPDDPTVALAQGRLLERMGFRRAAELDLERAAMLVPDSSAAYLALGRVRLGLAQPGPATRSLLMARELGDDSVELHRLLARAQRETGDWLAAHASYAAAIAREARQEGEASVELLVEAASLHTVRASDLEGCPHLTEALDWAARAALRDPQCERCHFVWAGLLELTGDVDGAVVQYRRTVEIDNLHLGAITNLALIYSDRGDLGQAQAMVERAVELETDARRRDALRALVR